MPISSKRNIFAVTFRTKRMALPRGVGMGGITLAGRIYRDTLKRERDEKKLLTRLRRQSWAVGGWIAGVATVVIGAGAKVLFEWFFGK